MPRSACAWRADKLAQDALQDLARRVAGHLRAQDELAWHLETRQFAPAMLPQHPDRQGLIWLQHNDRHGAFAPALIRNADNSSVRYLRQLIDDALDFG